MFFKDFIMAIISDLKEEGKIRYLTSQILNEEIENTRIQTSFGMEGFKVVRWKLADDGRAGEWLKSVVVPHEIFNNKSNEEILKYISENWEINT